MYSIVSQFIFVKLTAVFEYEGKILQGPPFSRNVTGGDGELELVQRGADVVFALKHFTSDLQLTVHSVSVPPQADLLPGSHGMNTGFLPQGRQSLPPLSTGSLTQTPIYIFNPSSICCHCHP